MVFQVGGGQRNGQAWVTAGLEFQAEGLRPHAGWTGGRDWRPRDGGGWLEGERARRRPELERRAERERARAGRGGWRVDELAHS